MEEILPLIIGILWLVYTFYKKGKKKEARRHQPVGSEEVKAPSILEQLFAANDVPEPQPYEMYEEPEDNTYVEDFDEVVIETNEKQSPFLNAELADFVNKGQVAITPSDNFMMEKEDVENQDNIPDFDIRKAIIFSEILNTPYIGYK